MTDAEAYRCGWWSAPEQSFVKVIIQTIAIDTVTNVGVFVEVEVLTADPSGDAELLDQVESDLGTTELPVISPPYRDLVMQASST